MSALPEVRWLVLTSDGRHVTVGRHRVSDKADLVRAAEALEAAGLAGWFVRMSGPYYGGREPELARLRLLTKCCGDWERVVRSFRYLRVQANTSS